MKHLILLIVMLLFSISAQAARYKYNELQIKDYDEMSKEVEALIRKAKETAIEKQQQEMTEEGDRLAVESLRNALKLIFSRPNKDNMVAKLVPSVKKELMNFNAYEDTLASLVTEAITILKSEKMPVVYRSTALFVLENIMSELKPMIDENEEYRKLVQKIKEADIKVSQEVANNRRLVSMYETTSPSETAEKILKANPLQSSKTQKK